MYVRNAWYVACTSDELKNEPLGRTICAQRMVFFRGEGGAVSALEDFCPHRGAPLSLGRVRDDGRIVCGYHGLVMGGDGRCVSMPGQRVATDDQVVPDHRALRLRLGLAGREERCRPGAAAPPAVGREPRVGLRRRPLSRQVRLPADDRQPDGPDARDLRPLDQHRPARDRGSGAGDAGRGRLGDHQPLHERHLGAAVLARGAARQPSRRRRAGRPLADLPLHAAEPRDDRGRRRPRRPRRLRRAGRAQGVERRGRLHHARDRRLDLVLLGHGAQLQRRRRGPHRDHPRGSGRDLRRGRRHPRGAADETWPSSRAAT